MLKLKTTLLSFLFLGTLQSFLACNTPVTSKKTDQSDVNTNSYKLTENPKKIDVVSLNGKEFDIIIFGDWPQSRKSESTRIINKKTIINGWECYPGNDSFFYAKVQTKGTENYFKMEPIQWRVLTKDYNGKILLLAEKALDAQKFYTSVDDRNINGEKILAADYEKSTIRAYLNGLNGQSYGVEDFTGHGFIDKAFSPAAKEQIQLTTVDNSSNSSIPVGQKEPMFNHLWNDTEDKIFLLSEREITTPEYGFSKFISMKDFFPERERYLVDYAKAIGASSYKSNGIWDLRSPYADNKVYTINCSGQNPFQLVHIVGVSIVPALTLESYN